MPPKAIEPPRLVSELEAVRTAPQGSAFERQHHAVEKEGKTVKKKKFGRTGNGFHPAYDRFVIGRDAAQYDAAERKMPPRCSPLQRTSRGRCQQSNAAKVIENGARLGYEVERTERAVIEDLRLSEFPSP